MGRAWTDLTVDEQGRVLTWADAQYRTMIRAVAPLWATVFQTTADGWLASPSAQASTPDAPAPDSVAALVLSLDPGEVIPVGASGLAGVLPIPAGMVPADMGAVEQILATYYNDRLRQYRVLVVGRENA